MLIYFFLENKSTFSQKPRQNFETKFSLARLRQGKTFSQK